MVDRASAALTPVTPAATVLARALRAMGAERAYGVMGAAVAHLASSLAEQGLDVVHVRHESGAAFMALEDSLVSGRPGVVFTTTGPGCTNALTGLAAASWEGGRVIMLVGASNGAPNRTYFQHTTSAMVPAIREILAAHRRADVAFLDTERALHRALAEWHEGLSDPSGFVGVGLVPLHMQTTPVDEWEPPREPAVVPHGETRGRDVARLLASTMSSDTVLWVGRGAAAAGPGLRRLVDCTGARVMCTPRAKGIFPESHPGYLGVVGYAGHASVGRHFAERRPGTVLILGSRLSEFSSFFDGTLAGVRQTFHIDVDPTAFAGTHFLGPNVRHVETRCEALVDAVLEELASTGGMAHQTPPKREMSRSGGPADVEAGVHPATLMASVQEVVVDGSDAVVMTEAGDAFAWGTHALRFDTPGRYRVSTVFGAMGHATCGVVGAALASGGPAVAIVGDGAMMMNNEVNTAAKYGVHAVWIVLNNATYSMIDHGMRSIDLPSMDLAFPRVDFAAVAEAMGGRGIAVKRAADLGPALHAAMEHGGPVVVDVATDSSVPPPFGARNTELRAQTGQDERWRG